MTDKLTQLNRLLDIDTSHSDDVDCFVAKLSNNFKFFDDLSDNRKIALIGLCFMYGFKSLLDKSNLLLALESQDYERASYEINKESNAYISIANTIKDDMI